jgi:hypothetical protein
MSLVESERMRRAAGWATYVSAAFWISGNVAVLLFYALEFPQSLAGGTDWGIFGPLSDYASLLQFVFLLPLPLALLQVSSSRQANAGVIAALGVIGSLLGAGAQALLVTDAITFEVNLPIILVALTLIGAWMFLASRRGRLEKFLSARLARLGVVTGTSLAFLTSLVLAGVVATALNPGSMANVGAFVQRTPALIGVGVALFTPGFLAYFCGVPLWLIRAGRRLLTGPLAQEQTNRRRAQAPA